MALLVALILLSLAAFPFGLFQDAVRNQIERQLDSAVTLGSVERREILSFSPTIVIRNLTIRQPAWAGEGIMARARTVEVRVRLLPLLVGKAVQTDSFVARGLVVHLVRNVSGRANWEGRKSSGGGGDKGDGFGRLVIPDGRLSLRDDKRHLAVSGTLLSDAKGLRIDARGRFHDAPAQLSVRGGRISGLASNAPYPAKLDLASPLLQLQAQAQMRGALNLKSMVLDIHAAAPNLKFLDDVIEAGLFGTHPIDLTARVRHDQKDWYIERMTGRIGHSTLVAKADVLKRDGRTKIDADVHFTQFDFDDLSDARGAALARTMEARIGKRVLPSTRINIAKVGPTDGVVRFRADRLLLDHSAFRSLAGVIRLDGKLLTIDNIIAGMSSGRMTGSLRIDQRGGVSHPRLSIDLAFADGRLETLIGSRDATGPLRGRVILAGAGDTIREALARSDGRAGLLVQDGTVKRTFAAVLGQDLGKAIGAALQDRQEDVALRCLAIGFAAKNGTLIPSPFIIDTGISVGNGQGQLSLVTEQIALTIKGQSMHPSALRLVDPIGVGGTLSAPTLSAAGSPPGSKFTAGTVVEALGKSIGHALGFRGEKNKAERKGPSTNPCPAMVPKIL